MSHVKYPRGFDYGRNWNNKLNPEYVRSHHQCPEIGPCKWCEEFKRRRRRAVILGTKEERQARVEEWLAKRKLQGIKNPHD